ncbi:MAG: HD domain-containing protein [Treponema sp.]|nr:HD domain-containing protein [Treponema sp.]
MTIANITLDIYNIILGLIALLTILISHANETSNEDLTRLHNWFDVMVVINIIMSTSDLFIMAFTSNSRPANFIVKPIAVFIYYCLGFFLLSTSIKCLKLLLDNGYKPTKFRKTFSIIFITTISLDFILLILTQFTGFLYHFDENNNYIRGPYFYIMALLQVIMYLDLFFYLIVNKKRISKIKIIITFSFILLPQIAQIFQLFFQGLSLINTGFAIVFNIMFIFSIGISENKLESTEIELTESQGELQNTMTKLERKNYQIIKMQDHTIQSLSNLVENRDEDTGEHVRRTMNYVELLALQMMKSGLFPDILTPKYIRYLRRAAPMHDIGKIVVPDSILKKPGRLTDEEFSEMKKHASEGGRIVHEILDGYEEPEYIQITADIATHHHEKWDGSGYPDRLEGQDIPLCARIMSLADVFDALISPRVYKEPYSYEEAFEIIEKGIGSSFDPIVAMEFLKIKDKLINVNESIKSEEKSR